MSAQLNASLLRLKLLDALRSGDTSKIDSLIEELSSTKATTQTTDLIHLKETILHYAVQVAPLSTLQHLVQLSGKYNLDINAQDPEGDTPLHLAAAASRLDVVKYLLSLPNINDTIVNLKKKQPVELCKDLNIAQLMQFERAKFVEKLACDLRQYFSSRDFDNLENILVLNPRASELLDINGADPQTGNTVLHEFIRKDDIQMCDWILKHGGDPFKRDKKGRLPIDLTLKQNDPLRKLLKSASKDQTIMDPVINTNNAIKTGGAPTYKGYLRKWTNFASGYKLRYFVLDQFGILSYYSSQDDTNNACRGSLNLSFAILHLDSSEKLKFEIIGKNGIRWHLKANHPIETNRWVWTLQNAITIAKDNLKKTRNNGTRNVSGTTTTNGESTENGSEIDDFPTNSNENSPNINSFDISRKSSTSRASVDESNGNSESKSKKRLLHIPHRKHRKTPSQYSTNSNASDNEEQPNDSLSRSSTFSKNQNVSLPTNLAKMQDTESTFLQPPSASTTIGFGDDQSNHTNSVSEDFDYDLDDYDSGDDDSNGPTTGSNEDLTGPLGDQVSTVKRALDVEISSLLDLFNLVATSETHENTEVYTVGIRTLQGIQDLYNKYNGLISSRDQKLVNKLERQAEVNQLWEQSIRQLETEISKREDLLSKYEGRKKQLKKYLSSGARPGPSTPGSSNLTRTSSSKDNLPTVGTSAEASKRTDGTEINDINENDESPDRVLQDILQDDSDDEFFDAGDFDESEDDESKTPSGLGGLVAAGAAGMAAIGGAAAAAGGVALNKGDKSEDSMHEAISSQKEETPNIDQSGTSNPSKSDQEQLAAFKSDNNDTSPNNIEQGASEKEDNSSNINKVSDPAQKSEEIRDAKTETDAVSEAQSKLKQLLNEEGSFLGYENPPRSKLSMDEDNRPKVGLWGILKNLIGKDMTRMTLPVSFNECTSLLQRLAEDIEYNNLLDAAASYDDSTLRMAYVATFAASEYASTIGRIAKPFNPLLGETFEYSRPDQNYRLITEQVSHHPPISACNAESIKWDYYGENAVDSQFKGRSFDFKHLGKMFCRLRPDNGVIDKTGNKVESETYSWKKVNTSVVGIMMGNPTVDNFGKMHVINHTTGDEIIVDMKQRGWKASSAYQLSGHVVDSKGNPRWAIGGHWNSKIYGKKISGAPKDAKKRGSADDMSDSLDTKESSDPKSGSKFLIWQAAPRPKGPFNLTQFAITLNGLDKSLEPWLAPTDTRLRPDQRAMEDGRFDDASENKHRVEEKQRNAKKQRELQKINYEPNWFVKKQHPITGDNYWEYNGNYWVNRRDHLLEKSGDIF